MSHTIEYAGGELVVNYDTKANLADGSVLLSHSGTTILATATFADEADNELDFIPLRVDYLERHYAVHQILGSRYSRREGKPSDEAILTARLVDRAIRPQLPAGLRHSLHVVITVLSLGTIDPDTLAITGASLAINKTGLTWNGPIAASRVLIGNDGKTAELKAGQMAENQLLVAGIKDLANITEFTGLEVAEEAISQAFIFGIEANNKLVESLLDTIGDQATSEKITNINLSLTDFSVQTNELADKLAVGHRPDGRSARELRSLEVEMTPLPGTHGSASFSRGNTSALAVTTLGSITDALVDSSIEAVKASENNRYFINHYNFPPYATGQAGSIGNPNRREIGHGYLVTRSIQNLLPKQFDYPYAVRNVCEILASDGSSSMAAVCASSLALYSAGVPITRFCAGIAIGLSGSLEEPIILTDIDESEDRHGLMDLKVAGTEKGITAIQLDTKNTGINIKVFNEGLSAGREARNEILTVMQSAIEGKTYSHPESAPLIVEIPREHIGRLIGKGGSNIRSIEETTGARISIENDRYGIIVGSAEAKRGVLTQIESETREYHVGEDFQATVREFLPYGAIVELSAGREALLHVSELRDAFVEKTEDLLKVGDEVPVTIVETSSDGRIKVSIREKHPEFFAAAQTEA